MRWFARAGWLTALMIVSLSGCAENGMVLKGQLNRLQQQQLAVTRQNQQFQARASGLDSDNQELESLVAQLRQQVKITEDQLAATRDQLRGVTSQLTEARDGKTSADNKVQALTASMRRQGGVSITPNNSLLQTLPAISLPEVHVRRDGDVIRIALPGNQLFESGSSQLRPGAASLVSGVAGELLATYPQQMIGVEGYTDSDPITGKQWSNNHQLSVARAMAVYDLLLSRSRYQANQLFIVGHGANHPVASNATFEGKQRNRRVELVVYPQKSG